MCKKPLIENQNRIWSVPREQWSDGIPDGNLFAQAHNLVCKRNKLRLYNEQLKLHSIDNLTKFTMSLDLVELTAHPDISISYSFIDQQA